MQRGPTGSRDGAGANLAHPDTRRSYLLRSMVVCHYDRRMAGRTVDQRRYTYYTCRPAEAHGPRARQLWPDHPKTSRSARTTCWTAWALQLQAPGLASGLTIGARTAGASYIAATCSVACSTSTGELHECVCAPFGHDGDPGGPPLSTRRRRSRS